MVRHNTSQRIDCAKRPDAFAKPIILKDARVISGISTHKAVMIYMCLADIFTETAFPILQDIVGNNGNTFSRDECGNRIIYHLKIFRIVQREQDPRLFVDHILRELAHRQDVFVVAAQLVVHDDGVLDAVTLLQDVIRQEAQFAVRINYEPCPPPDSYCCSMHLHTA